MKLAFVLPTVDRRLDIPTYTSKPHPEDPKRINYLGVTLANLRRSGLLASQTEWTLDIVDSGNSNESFQNEMGVTDLILDAGWIGRVAFHTTGWRRNANQNFLECFRIGLTRNADYVVFIEDDIDVVDHFADGVADWLTDHATNDCHIYIFGAACLPGNPRELKERAEKDGTMWPESQKAGEWTYPQRKFMGTQCIALRRDDVQSMVDWLTKDRQFIKRIYGYDCEMRRWAEEMYGPTTPFKCTAPSFVQHIGDESAIHLGRFHTYASWPGHDWAYQKRQP